MQTRDSERRCSLCRGDIVEIEYSDEVLVGCIQCNRWAYPGDDPLFMALAKRDIEALRDVSPSQMRLAGDYTTST
jgi:hypothetical protein